MTRRQEEAAARVNMCLHHMGLVSVRADNLVAVDLEDWCLLWRAAPYSPTVKSNIPPKNRQGFAEAMIAHAESLGLDEMAAGLREDLAKQKPEAKAAGWTMGEIVSVHVNADPVPGACDRARLFLSSLEDLSVADARQASELRHRLRAPGLGVLHEVVLFLGGVYPARPGQAALLADLMQLVGPPEKRKGAPAGALQRLAAATTGQRLGRYC